MPTSDASDGRSEPGEGGGRVPLMTNALKPLALASDHAGVVLKAAIATHLAGRGVAFVDLGTNSTESTDYPLWALKAARGVAAGDYPGCILTCGSGTGMAIAANKVHGVRAALCTNEYLGRYAKLHNDVNALCLGERVTGVDVALCIVDAWLDAKFEGGRHQRRVDEINEADKAR